MPMISDDRRSHHPSTKVERRDGPARPAVYDGRRSVTAMRIVSLDARDIRFPTSLSLDGSDAITRALTTRARTSVRTDSSGIEEHGLVHQRSRNRGRGRGRQGTRHVVVGRTLEDITADLRGWRSLASRLQLRWLGPEKA